MTGLVLDGCAGPGGFDLGARMLGLDPIGIEWDRDACATRAAAGLRTVRMDITTMDTAPLAGRLDGLLFSPPCQAFSMAGQRKGETDKRLIWRALDDLARGVDSRAELTARASDPRSTVVVEPLRFALECRPRWMVWEQVPPVLAIWRHCANHLRAAGYWVWTGVINSADYGVPQTRRRAILLASLDGPVGYPEPTHTGQPANEMTDLFGSVPRLPWVSMAEALGFGLTGEPAPVVMTARNRQTGHDVLRGSSWRAEWWARAKADPARWVVRTEQLSDTAAGRVPIERRGDQPAPTLVANADRWELRVGVQANATTRPATAPAPAPAPALFFGHQSGDVKWRLRNNTQDNAAARELDEPAPTLFFGARLNDVSWVRDRPATTIQGDPPVGRPGHKDRDKGESQFEQDSVRITVAQAAVLQSFPADWPFQGTKTARFRQVGDAVPPLLAAHCIAAAAGIPLARERAA